MNGLSNQLQGNLTPEQMRTNEEQQYRAMYGDQAFAERKANELSKETKARLRDEFAMHAPPPPKSWRGGEQGINDLIEWRWSYADKMIKAREVKP